MVDVLTIASGKSVGTIDVLKVKEMRDDDIRALLEAVVDKLNEHDERLVKVEPKV